jgi:hypothetical protein
MNDDNAGEQDFETFDRQHPAIDAGLEPSCGVTRQHWRSGGTFSTPIRTPRKASEHKRGIALKSFELKARK